MSIESEKFETQAVRTQTETTQFSEHSVPLYLTSGFIFEDAEEMRAAFAEEKQRDLYSRYSNPNTNEFVAKICKLEGAEDGFAFATGMAAVYATFAALLNAGDHIISCRSVFGATHALFTKYFPKWDIETSYFRIDEVDRIERLIKPTTKMIYAESPTNPGVDVLDLALLANIAKKHQLLLVIDNCFATPYLQTPIQFGADLVIHSATKLIDGQGRVLGGVTVGSKELIREIYLFSRITGPAMSPFNAWVLSKSLETLGLRMDRHCHNASTLAEYLYNHKEVIEVIYPHHHSYSELDLAKKQMSQGGGLVGCRIKGGADRGKRFLNALNICSRTANLGDSRTIATHPASTTHSKLTNQQQLEANITPNYLRFSVGLEHIDDILKDIDQAISVSK